MAEVKFTTIPTKRLTETINSSSTSFRINNILGWDGVTNLTASDFGTKAYGVFRNSTNTQIEFFAFDPATIASSEITILYRGLALSGENRSTEVTANKLTWIKGDTLVELGADSSMLLQWLKEYIDGIAVAGSPDASTTAKGLVEEATQAEIDANTAAGATGARLAINPSTLATSKYGTSQQATVNAVSTSAGAADAGKLAKLNASGKFDESLTNIPIVRTYTTTSTFKGDTTSRFDIINTSGTTYRYTWDGTGTDPVISLGTIPVGSGIYITSSALSAGNRGAFITTGGGANYFEVTNASGVAENDKLLTAGFLAVGAKWTKPTGLKYIVVETQGGGGGGGGCLTTSGSASGGGGGGGGYSKKLVSGSSLSSTEVYIVGGGGSAGSSSPTNGSDGKPTAFGNILLSNAGAGGVQEGNGGAGGSSTGGDINISGQNGSNGNATASAVRMGGSSYLGLGGASVNDGAGPSSGYGSGGAGGDDGSDAGGEAGSDGSQGIVIVTEYYN